MAYDQAQFEACFQLITAVSHQIIKIDFAEMENWMDKLLGARSLKEEDTKKNMENLKTVMRQFVTMQEVLRIHGIPVRDIQNYRDVVPTDAGINVDPRFR